MRRQPASLLAEKPDMLMLKFLAFGWYSVNAIVKLKPFGFLFSIDIFTLLQSNLAIRNGLIRNKLVLRIHFL